jgi:hypothetical protein
VANESQRVRMAAHPRIWIISGNASYQGVDLGNALLGGAENAGGSLMCQFSGEAPAADLFDFAPGPSGC